MDTEQARRVVEDFNASLGRLLKAHPPEQYMGEEGAGATWLEGACWLLAYGVVEWLGQGTDRCALLESGEQVHVVVRVGDSFIDGDGLSSRGTLLRRWREEYGRDVLIGDFDATQFMDPESDVSAEAFQRLVACLHTLPHRDSLPDAEAALGQFGESRRL